MTSRVFIRTSVVLQRLHDEAPPDHFTLAWLMDRLRKRSFGMIMLRLALVTMVPGISIPRRIATRPLPITRQRLRGA